jgi:hypothetical protein
MKTPRIITLILVLSVLLGATSVAGAMTTGIQTTSELSHVKFAHLAPFDSELANTELTVKVGTALDLSKITLPHLSPKL